MPKISIETEIDINKVIKSFSKLNISELELLISEFNTLLAAKKTKSKQKRIEKLNQLIRQSVLSPSKLAQYEALVYKLESRTMTEKEQEVFSALTEEDEKLRNQRIAYMIELSQLREVPFSEIQEAFSFKSKENV